MNWLRWRGGRQGSMYKKLLLFRLPRADAYLLHYPTGSHIAWHTDPVPGFKHYRLNIVIEAADRGGRFRCWGTPLFASEHVHLFRSDQPHMVTTVLKGRRVVLSFGFLRKDRSATAKLSGHA